MTFSDQNKMKRERPVVVASISKTCIYIFIYLHSAYTFLHALISCNANVESGTRCFVDVVIYISLFFVALMFFAFCLFTKIRFFYFYFFLFYAGGPISTMNHFCLSHSVA